VLNLRFGGHVKLKTKLKQSCLVRVQRLGKWYVLGVANSRLRDKINLWWNTKRWNLSTYAIKFALWLMKPLEDPNGAGTN
jgi:hypothetical protein